MKISEADYRIFEIYAKEYKKLVQNNDNDTISKLEEKMNDISTELTTYAKEFCKLDTEFKYNALDIEDPIIYFMEYGVVLNASDYIYNTSWEGYWKKCSGRDLEYFMSYLEYPIIYPNHKIYLENDKNLLKVFKKETGFSKIPYGISCAEQINQKIIK